MVSWLDFTSTATTNRWQADEVNWFNASRGVEFGNDLTEPKTMMVFRSMRFCGWMDGTAHPPPITRRQWSNEKNYFVLASAVPQATAR